MFKFYLLIFSMFNIGEYSSYANLLSPNYSPVMHFLYFPVINLLVSVVLAWQSIIKLKLKHKHLRTCYGKHALVNVLDNWSRANMKYSVWDRQPKTRCFASEYFTYQTGHKHWSDEDPNKTRWEREPAPKYTIMLCRLIS